MSLALEQASSGSFNFSKGAVGTGTTTSQIAIAAPISYTLDGIWQTVKGAVASIPLVAPTGFILPVVLPIGFKQAYGVWLDAAGVVTITAGVQSPYTAVTDPVGAPANPGSRCCVAVFTVAATTAAFVPGTTLFGTGNVVAYKDVFNLPGSAIA